MRIGKHKGCGGELYLGEMEGNGIGHAINLVCGKCGKHISNPKIGQPSKTAQEFQHELKRVKV